MSKLKGWQIIDLKHHPRIRGRWTCEIYSPDGKPLMMSLRFSGQLSKEIIIDASSQKQALRKAKKLILEYLKIEKAKAKKELAPPKSIKF